jgi:transposase
MALAIIRTEHSAEVLRREARRSKDNRQARRLLAIAMVLDGASREAAARAAGMDRQTLRDWVHRYNAQGVAGLIDRKRSGRRPRLDEDQLRELDSLIEEGPAIAVNKVVRWRCADLKAALKERFGVEVSERHVGRILKKRGFRRLSVRPRHPQADEAAQETFKKTSQRR